MSLLIVPNFQQHFCIQKDISNTKSWWSNDLLTKVILIWGGKDYPSFSFWYIPQCTRPPRPSPELFTCAKKKNWEKFDLKVISNIVINLTVITWPQNAAFKNIELFKIKCKRYHTWYIPGIKLFIRNRSEFIKYKFFSLLFMKT